MNQAQVIVHQHNGVPVLLFPCNDMVHHPAVFPLNLLIGRRFKINFTVYQLIARNWIHAAVHHQFIFFVRYMTCGENHTLSVGIIVVLCHNVQNIHHFLG